MTAAFPYDETIVLYEGCIRKDYESQKTKNLRLPTLIISTTKQKLFTTFVELCSAMPEVVSACVSVTNETRDISEHWRLDIDIAVALSVIEEHRDLLVENGCLGISLMSTDPIYEVHFDEHKTICVYHQEEGFLARTQSIAHEMGIHYDGNLRTVIDAAHYHRSDEYHAGQTATLIRELGAELRQTYE